MENKYYTPELSEFCVGFEYESRVAGYNAEWVSSTIYAKFERGWESNLEEEISMYIDGANEFRAKYLDSQDIIDCGFMKAANDPVRQKWIDVLSFEGNDCRIEFFPYIESIPEQLRGIVTVFTTLNYGGSIKFHGKVKNKHELKNVLKQIGVL